MSEILLPSSRGDLLSMLSWGLETKQGQGKQGALVYTVLVILLIMIAVMGVFIKIIISDQADMQIRLESLEKNVDILRKMVEQVKHTI